MEKELTLTEQTQVESALEIAKIAHEDQYDEDGFPHIVHVMRVAAGARTPQEIATALLHDTVEDTDVELSLLAPFGETITEALHLLTRSSGTYADYIERIATATGEAGELARTVKRLDLADNLKRSTAADDKSRIKRYTRALARLD
jgi:(p)ppGpp synthase/HD superfamily hydrolase